MTGVAWADGPYAIIPAWLLDEGLSDRAIRLFCVLARYANTSGHGATPSRKTLGEKLTCSVSSVDRALDELVDARAVTRRERRRADGGRTTDELVLSSQRTTPLPTGGERALVMGEEAKNENQTEREKTSSTAPRSRQPNVVWDALVAVTGFTPTTTSEKSDFAKTVRELRAVIPQDASDANILSAMQGRRRAWERAYGDARFTHRVLRGKWAELGALANGSGSRAGGGLPELKDGETF